MKTLFSLLIGLMVLFSSHNLFADKNLLELPSSPEYLTVSNPSIYNFISVSDNPQFYINFANSLNLYDIQTCKRLLTLTTGKENYTCNRFAYINDKDSTLYYSTADSENIFLVRVNLNTPTVFDTLTIGTKFQLVLFYHGYDRNTLYTYQNGNSINEIDLVDFKIKSSRPALDFVQVNSFAVDSTLKILHLETYQKYLALDFNTLEDYYSYEHQPDSYTRVSVSPNGETAVLILNQQQGFGEAIITLINVPEKKVLRVVDNFRQSTSARFLNDDEIIFNVKSNCSCVYRIADSSIIFKDSFATLIQAIKYNGEMAILSWKNPAYLSIINPYTNSVIKNFYNVYSPLAIIGDTLITRNSGSLEYWNFRTQTKVLDTLCRIGWITENKRSALTFSDGNYSLNELSDLSAKYTNSLPFAYEDYFSVEAVSYDGTKLIGQLGFKFDSIVEYDIRNAKCLDTFAITNHSSILMSDLLFSNTLQYYIDKDNITTIYKLKTNDTLLSIPDAYQITFSNDDSMIAVIDTNKFFYQVDIATGAKTPAIKIPIYRAFYSFPPPIFINHDKQYALFSAKSTIDESSPNAIWIIDLKNNKISRTILMNATLKCISDTENIFVYGSEYSNYVYSYDINPSAVIDSEVPLHSISIYPQPASDFVSIKSNNGIIKSIKIFDNNGKIILMSDSIGSELLEISTINMAKGVYHFSLETENSTKSGNFVIN